MCFYLTSFSLTPCDVDVIFVCLFISHLTKANVGSNVVLINHIFCLELFSEILLIFFTLESLHIEYRCSLIRKIFHQSFGYHF